MAIFSKDRRLINLVPKLNFSHLLYKLEFTVAHYIAIVWLHGCSIYFCYIFGQTYDDLEKRHISNFHLFTGWPTFPCCFLLVKGYFTGHTISFCVRCISLFIFAYGFFTFSYIPKELLFAFQIKSSHFLLLPLAERLPILILAGSFFLVIKSLKTATAPV